MSNHDRSGGLAPAEKIREIGLRRIAARRGMRVERSRCRDPRARQTGRYRLAYADTGEIIAGYSPRAPYLLDLDGLAAALNAERSDST